MRWLKTGVIFGMICFVAYMGYQYYLSLLPLLDAYGELEIRQFTSAVVVHEKKEAFKQDLTDKIIMVQRNADGQIESIDYDMIYVNQMIDALVSQTEGVINEVQEGKYQAKDNSRYEKYLESISEKEGVLTSIPLETFISLPLVSFLHWRIPVRFQVVSNVVGKVEQKIENYGINNTLIKINVKITMHQKMMLPFFRDIKTIEIEFPIAMRIISGQIPNVYMGENYG